MLAKIETLPTLEWGHGEQAFVFLHYFGGSAASWKWVFEQMPNYRCIAISLPGFGGTPAPEQPSLQYYTEAVCATIAHLALKNYTLVGHSMGGKIALNVAVEAEQKPQKVVLIAPSPATTEPMPDDEKERMLKNHPSEENAKTTIEGATKQPLNEEQYTLAIQTHTIVDNGVWRWWLLEGMNHSIADRVSQLSIPVVVLASQDDPVIPCDKIQSDVIDIIPNSRLIATKNVGHLIPLEATEWVVKQLQKITVELET
ncbi:MAG: alpha/beta hydrolase [Cyanobacteriota bacterium]|nr:alpha/beta hydrolase [Cyanobacteriota bacterium]